MKVIGIDPGYERLGLAIIEHDHGRPDQLLYSTCLTTAAGQPFPVRLYQLANQLEKILLEYRPEILVLEKIFFTSNQKTAVAVAEVRGVVTYLAQKHGLAILDLTPLEVKMTITGYGRADKNQMKNMIVRLLGVTQSIQYDDETDAMAIAVAGALQAPTRLIHKLETN
ncbi:MAG: crossover junction endodeoxyribonuclease RuvC [Patescibacteria group bacterium]